VVQPPRRDAVTSRLRLRGHDYAAPGAYFVTVCTEQRTCLFGEVHDDQVMLSHAGQVIESWWESIVRRYPSVVLDAMVVMPNHVHGIVMIPAIDPVNFDSSTPNLSALMHRFKTKSTNDYIVGVRTEGGRGIRADSGRRVSTITLSGMRRSST
jgi:putative transposase